MTNISYECYALGESAIVVQLGTRIDPTIHEQIRQLAAYIEANSFPGYREMVTAYTTITIYYDSFAVYTDQANTGSHTGLLPYERVLSYIQATIREFEQKDMTVFHEPHRVVEIPVCYGGLYGPDLEEVAFYHGISAEEVIHRHTSQVYPVYMIGFAPGFPYLGGMDERIATPRKKVPRERIPAGSVGIGGSQTGIYSLETPGGWNLIGRTPLALFQPKASNPTLLNVGDRVRFVPITGEQYDQQAERDELNEL
ncbi:5-oxoprolinase subunit PxpB [Paenibacillus sedimenti]|uniref:5-oxoprolinase subunit PxpB n=1 Tax=Paenibacillus sedimenti TaxID=2770274 RepID=A0A926KN46_9BACL|nr:5-oxoprolinase subunit PxpB [Paenibacillus sedimenti]MBD0380026.1 5-oxoprolinase subunit PxpB [Paenibacillus sedimenti]